MSDLIVVPARLESTRMKQKLLRADTGKPLLAHTLERLLTNTDYTVVVAYDDGAIVNAVAPLMRQFRHRLSWHRTPLGLPSGTARVFDVWRRIYECEPFVVNVQGDEPEVDLDAVRLLFNNWKFCGNHLTTVCCPADLVVGLDPSAVKVVRGQMEQALYFSRSPIPHGGPYWRHVGIYGYSRHVRDRLHPYATGMENESLEQLSWLYSGYQIRVIQLDWACPLAIDTEESYQTFVRRYKEQNPS